MTNLVSGIAFGVVVVWCLFVGGCSIFTIGDYATGQTVAYNHKVQGGITHYSEHDSLVSEHTAEAKKITRSQWGTLPVGDVPSFSSEKVTTWNHGFRNHRDPDLGPAVIYGNPENPERVEFWVWGKKYQTLEEARSAYATWRKEYVGKKAPPPPQEAPPQ